MLQGWCWWIAVWVVLKGLGEGSWDAAPLSGSRGLSSGWAHQSSLGKVSSGISEIMELGIGKGDAMQGMLQSTAQATGEAEELGETENSPFTCPCRRHTARRADRVHKLPHLAVLMSLSSPGFRAGLSAAGARLLRGSAPFLEIFRTGVREPWRARR